MTRMPARSAFFVAGLYNATFDRCSGISLSMIPPVTPYIGFGRWCFLTLLAPSTSTCSESIIRSTVPRLPLSRPVVTITSSPLRILLISHPRNISLQRRRDAIGSGVSVPLRISTLQFAALQHFRRERYDLHEALGPQLPCHRPEYSGADRFELRRQQYGGVGIEPYDRAIAAAHAFSGAHDDRVVDLALFHASTRRCVLDAHLDHIAYARVAALRAAQYLDAHDRARACVIGHVQNGLHLYHRVLAKTLLQLDPRQRAAASIGARPGQVAAPTPAGRNIKLLLRASALRLDRGR